MERYSLTGPRSPVTHVRPPWQGHLTRAEPPRHARRPACPGRRQRGGSRARRRCGPAAGPADGTDAAGPETPGLLRKLPCPLLPWIVQEHLPSPGLLIWKLLHFQISKPPGAFPHYPFVSHTSTRNPKSYLGNSHHDLAGSLWNRQFRTMPDAFRAFHLAIPVLADQAGRRNSETKTRHHPAMLVRLWRTVCVSGSPGGRVCSQCARVSRSKFSASVTLPAA